LERGTRDLSQHTLLQTDKNNSQFKWTGNSNDNRIGYQSRALLTGNTPATHSVLNWLL
jgi:hypothetical protein